MILVLPYDLSFKVICDFQRKTYTDHAIYPSLLPIDILHVLHIGNHGQEIHW